jgi:hypothetical protein
VSWNKKRDETVLGDFDQDEDHDTWVQELTVTVGLHIITGEERSQHRNRSRTSHIKRKGRAERLENPEGEKEKEQKASV